MGADDKPDTETDDSKAFVKFDDLKAVVTEVLSDMGITKGKSEPVKDETKTGSGAGLAEEVQAQLAKIKADEDAQNEKKTTGERLAAIEDKVKEKPPVERRRVHKLMGWGE